MTKQQLIASTEGFPPVQHLASALSEVDYQKVFQTFLSFIITVAAFIAAVVTVIRDKWVEHNCTERVQLFALTAYEWVQKNVTPAVIEFSRDMRSLYVILSGEWRLV